MNSEKTAIKVLACTAVLLLLALVFLPARPATAQIAVKDQDYLVCTFPASAGSDALYIAETRTYGMVMVLMYDPKARQLIPRAGRRLDDAFVGR